MPCARRRLLIPAAVALASVAGCLSNPIGCDDGIQDGVETGPDCGGGICPACRLGFGCLVGSDCRSGRCAGGICSPTRPCGDGKRDGRETDVDCGGPDCVPCPLGRHCAVAGDCRSGHCTAGVCAPIPGCTNGILDGDESDVDCGGSCPQCDTGATCRTANDCTSDSCVAGVCRAMPCSDGIKDGDETDVDCGGGTCAQCPAGAICLVGSDCLSSACVNGRCIAIKNLCPAGYLLGAARLCVCDPVTCGSCCDVDEGNLCGLPPIRVHNNCGTHGQSCFRCDINQHQSCEHAPEGDYCAAACEDGPCAGCCSGPREQRLTFCLHGDVDWACGSDGKHCGVCQLGEHCVGGRCIAIGGPDGG